MTRTTTAEPSVDHLAPPDLATVGARTVDKVMTRDVVTLDPGLTLPHAMSRFVERGLTAMPVVDAARRLVGMLTETDLMRVLGRGEAGYPRLLELVRHEDLRSCFTLRARGSRR